MHWEGNSAAFPATHSCTLNTQAPSVGRRLLSDFCLSRQYSRGEEAEAKVEHVTFELRVLTPAQGNEMKHPKTSEQLVIRTAEYVAKVVFFFFQRCFAAAGSTPKLNGVYSWQRPILNSNFVENCSVDFV